MNMVEKNRKNLRVAFYDGRSGHLCNREKPMWKIKITNVYTEKIYQQDKHKWDKYQYIQMEISPMPLSQKVGLCKFLLQKTDDPFAQATLSELATDENIPLDIVKDIFRKGDIGCKVSVCLRNHIDDEIKFMCTNCLEEDVVEHYLHKHKNITSGDF